MRRLLPILVAAAIVAGLATGVAVLANGDGPFAFRVRGHETSQRSVDDEYRELAENAALQRLIARAKQQGQNVAPLSTVTGSVTSDFGASWLGLLVGQELVRQDVARSGLQPTAADRAEGRTLAAQAIGGPSVIGTFPSWLRDRMVHRWTGVAILERRLVEKPTPAFLQSVKAQCPSGRYVAHILVASVQQATAIKRLLDQGDDFARLAKANSKDAGSAAAGGELGCLDRAGITSQAFIAAATAQPIGVVSDPVQTDAGYHLILVSDQPPASELPGFAVTEVLRTATRGKDVDVDPRYGRWDHKNGQVLPASAPSG